MELSAPEPLGEHHDVSAFDCGKPALDGWLKRFALGNQRHGFTRVMVVCAGDMVVGFYGLAPTAVPPALLSRALRTGQPPDPVPCILFGQLAVDRAYIGRGIGSALMRHALERCVAASEAIGGRAVIVRAIDSEAEQFWRDAGFEPTRDDPSILFRSLPSIAAWLASTRQH